MLTIAGVQKLLDPLKRKVVNMLARAVVKEIDDSGKVQILSVSVLKGELQDNVERLQNYGFTSVPPPNSEAFIAYVNGNRNHGIALIVENREKRLVGLPPGAVGVFTSEENKMVLDPETGFATTTQDWALTTEKYSISTPKVKIGSEDAELVSLLVDLVQAILDGKVATATGPQPLVNPAFAQLKTKLSSLKE